MFKIARQGHGYDFYDDIDDCEVNQIDVNEVDRDYVKQHKLELIKAVIDGYEVEEPKFRVMVLPGYFLKNPVTTSPFVQQLFTTHFDDPATIWRISDYKLLLSNAKDWQPFLPPFSPNDPHFEKVEDDDE